MTTTYRAPSTLTVLLDVEDDAEAASRLATVWLHRVNRVAAALLAVGGLAAVVVAGYAVGRRRPWSGLVSDELLSAAAVAASVVLVLATAVVALRRWRGGGAR